jgi:NAD(P)-dependent dehydrogenase (short-subunit alcohol dehydrogenase family)
MPVSAEAKTARPPQSQSRQPGRENLMRPQPDYMPRFKGSNRLENKVSIITGGDSGIGRACSVLFAREGAKIAIVYKEESEDAEETKRLIEAEGSQAILIPGDIGNREFCRNAVAQTVDTFGDLHVLINNAAEQHAQKDLRDIDEGQLARTFKTNIFGYFFTTQAALDHLKKGGAIVNTTSITAYRGSKELIDYSSTKGAIVSFTRSLAQSLAKDGIRVNAVAPGPIWTPLIPASFDPDKVAQFGTGQPLGRAGEPNEVASCHLFLASDDSSYMTGQVLHPNGGEIVGG